MIDEPWPAVDAAALEQSTVELVVQVNGKLRSRIAVPAGADEGRCAKPRSRIRMCRNSSARRRAQGHRRAGKLVNVVV